MTYFYEFTKFFHRRGGQRSIKNTNFSHNATLVVN